LFKFEFVSLEMAEVDDEVVVSVAVVALFKVEVVTSVAFGRVKLSTATAGCIIVGGMFWLAV
jgi:hypothetical protein